jgi:hypothetical protein
MPQGAKGAWTVNFELPAKVRNATGVLKPLVLMGEVRKVSGLPLKHLISTRSSSRRGIVCCRAVGSAEAVSGEGRGERVASFRMIMEDRTRLDKNIGGLSSGQESRREEAGSLTISNEGIEAGLSC